MPDLSFDEHARAAMQDDSVSEDDVYLVVGDADVEYERSDGRTIYERLLDDGRYIVVIVENVRGIVLEDSTEYIVIVDEVTQIVRTVWWDKRQSRRRRGR